MKLSHLVVFLVAWLTSVPVYLYFSTEDEFTCENMVAEMWATRSCLALRPACHGLSQEDFLMYHKFRNRFEEQCGEDRGDTFLSQ